VVAISVVRKKERKKENSTGFLVSSGLLVPLGMQEF
jgi:hypothetical protein